MTVVAGKRIVSDSLVFSYDMNNSKSWRGKPTTNHIYYQNPRIDESYAPYTRTATWNTNHPDAITVYNTDGGNISNYVNEGVNGGVWETTYHAIWTYEQELKEPVVTLRDVDNVWKAKSFALPSTTYTSMGLSHGDYYTLSWLQWTNDINKTINAGLYVAHIDTGVRSFYDGMSPNAGANAYNTKANTWQRIYATFQVSTSVNLSASVNLYMYGHRGGGGTIKLSDVQLEIGDIPSPYSNTLDRTNSQSLVDSISDTETISYSLTYSSNNEFEFNGTSDYIRIAQPNVSVSPNVFSITGWIYPGDQSTFFISPSSAGSDHFIRYDNSQKRLAFQVTEAADVNNHAIYSTTNSVPLNTWSHFSCNISDRYRNMYINGEFASETTSTYDPAGWTGYWYLGARANGTSYRLIGKLPNLNIYNRILTAEEVKQHYLATKGLYGVV